MDSQDASSVISKICGPILVVISPLSLATFSHALIMKTHVDEPSIKDLLIIFSFSFAGLLTGIYLCRREYGWFGGNKS